MLRSERGQLLIPAMFVFPTLFLFVFLIKETAQLSTEKIRHQFAMDAAVFVEMANYSDFLNRTAYVNGAFPMRIFEEGYVDFPAECEGKSNCSKTTYDDVLFDAGVFPRSPDKMKYADNSYWGPLGSWPIAYGGAVGELKNASPPDMPLVLKIFDLDFADRYWHSKDLADEIYKLYVQIYGLLGSVEDSQLSVLKKLSSNYEFLHKSYQLNTGDATAGADADTLAASFRQEMPDFTNSSVARAYCQEKVYYCGNVHTGSLTQPYHPECTTPDTGVVITPTSAGCSAGLFQIMYVEQSAIAKVRSGLPLTMSWAIPEKNYWNVNFASLLSGNPNGGRLHTTISLKGDPANQPAVWPNPTPRFQVRQFP